MSLVVKKAEPGPAVLAYSMSSLVACSCLTSLLATHSTARWDMVSLWVPQKAQMASGP